MGIDWELVGMVRECIDNGLGISGNALAMDWKLVKMSSNVRTTSSIMHASILLTEINKDECSGILFIEHQQHQMFISYS